MFTEFNFPYIRSCNYNSSGGKMYILQSSEQYSQPQSTISSISQINQMDNDYYQETSSSSSVQSAKNPKKTGKKKSRTHFTGDQLITLENEFLKNNYLSRASRKDLAELLNLPENRIKVWFQNRRVKNKRHKPTKDSTDMGTTRTFPPFCNSSSPSSDDGYIALDGHIYSNQVTNSSPDFLQPQLYDCSMQNYHNYESSYFPTKDELNKIIDSFLGSNI